MKLETIEIKKILNGSASIPAYIEFFDTIDKRTHMHSIKTFKKHFKLSDEQTEEILENNK